MKKNDRPIGRKDEIVVQNLDGEVLIYDLKINKAYCLNETSALVWQMCDGNNSVSDISQELGKKLNASATEDLVWFAIDQLKKEKLIANSEELANNFEGLNRRQVIKKVGLASMIALPIVAGMVAPKAIHAASTALQPAGTMVSANSTQNPTTVDAATCMTNLAAQCQSGTVTGVSTGCGGGMCSTCTGTCG